MLHQNFLQNLNNQLIKMIDGHSHAVGNLPTAEQILHPSDLIELKKCIYASQRSSLPPICTHNVCDDINDPILNALRRCQLFNARFDRVKVIFHPEFLRSTSPLLPLDYEEFVRGCHLGVFPSYYEPWGYTPAECTVMGIPSISTNLSGFGCFMEEHVSEPQTYGIYVVDRRYKGPEESCQQLSQYMFDFSQLTRRQRIILRNRTERLSELLDWNTLGIYYYRARQMVLQRTHPEFEEELLKITNESFSAPSTPAVSRSSTPAPPEHDEGTDDEEEQDSYDKTHIEAKTPPIHEPDDEPHLERADSVRLLPMRKKVQNDTDHAASATGPKLQSTITDANDDEVHEITSRKGHQGITYVSTSNSKPGLLPDAHTTALNDKLNLGLPDRGTFSDSHDGKKQAPNNDTNSSISTQKDFSLPDTFLGSLGGADTASFEPTSTIGAQYSSAFIDQQAAKSIGKEQI
ncbi:unnamed protein product [Rotaria sp. Silwood2]|nr:unnamed protein product [Rotaria sp. Silwood2]